jgi:hypothetical protein
VMCVQSVPHSVRNILVALELRRAPHKEKAPLPAGLEVDGVRHLKSPVSPAGVPAFGGKADIAVQHRRPLGTLAGDPLNKLLQVVAIPDRRSRRLAHPKASEARCTAGTQSQLCPVRLMCGRRLIGKSSADAQPGIPG